MHLTRQTITKKTKKLINNFSVLDITACIIIFVACVLQILHADKHRLPSYVDCGEIFISELQVRNLKLFGVQNALLEDHATSPNINDHPNLYTHNVNILTMFYIFLYKIGLQDFETRQLAVLGIYAIGLFLAYIAISTILKSRLAGIICLAMLASSVFISHYAFHGLRGFHILAIFSAIWLAYTICSRQNIFSLKGTLGIFFISLINFGIGYEFWFTYLTFLCITTFMVYVFLRQHNTPYKDLSFYFKSIILILSINFIIFSVRQLNVLMALGYEYWSKDFYYTFAIKIPGMSRLISIPDSQSIQEFYNKRHILKPPAISITKANLGVYIDAFVTHFKYSVLPKIGLFNIAIIFVFYCSYIYKAIKNTISREDKNFLILISSLFLSMLISCVLFLQLWIEQYIGHFHPMIIFPCIIILSFVLYKTLKYTYVCYKQNLYIKCSLAALFAITLICSHLIVQSDNLYFSKKLDFSWIEFVKNRNHNSFAIGYLGAAAAAFTNNFVIELSQNSAWHVIDKIGNNDVNVFNEKPDYLLYFNSTQRTDSWAHIPICRFDFFTANLLRHFKDEDISLLNQEKAIIGSAGSRVEFYSKVYDPMLKIDSIFIDGDTERKQNNYTHYNCEYNQFYASFYIPSAAKAGQTLSLPITTKLKNGKLKVIGQATIIVDNNSNQRLNKYPDWVPPPTVSTILTAYHNMSVVESKSTHNSQDGFIVFDLRDIK